MGELRIMGKLGDTKKVWDPENEKEVETAEAEFENLIEDGYTAYKVGKKGKKGTKMKKFDPDAGAVIMVPEMVGG